MSKEIKACRAPDPNPIKPTFKLPPNACDAHCHVFGPAAQFPYAEDRSYTPPDAGFEMLQALHKHLGFSRAVIVHASCHGTDNTVTLDAIKRSNGAYRGVAMLHAGVTDSQLADLNAGGMRGMRFNFVKHLGGMQDIALFDKLVERAEPLGWHVVLHLDAEDLEEHAPRIKRMKVPFVIDHMGRAKAADSVQQKPFQILLDLMRHNPLAWVKICGSERVSVGKRPFKDAVPFAQALIEAAPDRVLWGTDWPHPNISKDMPNDGELVDLFPEFTSDPAIQQKILVDNPARLYGF
ncbi:MAG: amidohydrolase 2 [Betaproteobacteria bacterium]|nr:amidohydrolase 2 [Betaproteobacteria bacterium]